MTTTTTRLRRSEVPGYLKARYNLTRSAPYLGKLAVIGGGPTMTYIGRVPYYDTADLDAWVAAMSTGHVSSTSELKALRAAA